MSAIIGSVRSMGEPGGSSSSAVKMGLSEDDRHEAQPPQRGHEEADGDDQGHRPQLEHGQEERPVDADEDRVASATFLLLHLQEHHAQQRDDREGEQPRRQQRDQQHDVERPRVLAHVGLSQEDRQERGRRGE